jgi:hypothetical protein
MAFADDLLAQAYHLAAMERKNPKQASLRRAVSTAYYALFHLLINDAVGNWRIVRQRSILARTFEHGKMRAVCETCVKNFYSSGQPATEVQLKNVARAFILLQQERHIADYDNSFVWLRTNAVAAVDMASAAFSDWASIRTQEIAQDYLLALFLPKTR